MKEEEKVKEDDDLTPLALSSPSGLQVYRSARVQFADLASSPSLTFQILQRAPPCLVHGCAPTLVHQHLCTSLNPLSNITNITEAAR